MEISHRQMEIEIRLVCIEGTRRFEGPDRETELLESDRTFARHPFGLGIPRRFRPQRLERLDGRLAAALRGQRKPERANLGGILGQRRRSDAPASDDREEDERTSETRGGDEKRQR
jgi:hypothetical protein